MLALAVLAIGLLGFVGNPSAASSLPSGALSIHKRGRIGLVSLPQARVRWAAPDARRVVEPYAKWSPDGRRLASRTDSAFG
jgi:hypothetical protein